MTAHHPLILASASPRRQDLLKQVYITPSGVFPANIDETPHKTELPRDLAKRLALAKADFIRAHHPDHFILAADTVVSCGRRILPKAETEDQARTCLTLLSGRRHHVYGGICVITPEGKTITRVCDTVVKFKILPPRTLDNYIQSGEWRGKAGGYAIQGLATAYVSFLQGSYSNVVGLSLYDTLQILDGNGFFKKS